MAEKDIGDVFPGNLYIGVKKTFGMPLIEVYRRLDSPHEDLQHVIKVGCIQVGGSTDITANSTLRDLADLLSSDTEKYRI